MDLKTASEYKMMVKPGNEQATNLSKELCVLFTLYFPLVDFLYYVQFVIAQMPANQSCRKWVCK